MESVSFTDYDGLTKVVFDPTTLVREGYARPDVAAPFRMVRLDQLERAYFDEEVRRWKRYTRRQQTAS